MRTSLPLFHALVLCTALLTSAAQAQSPLEQLADSMAPGTWAELTVSNQNSVLGVGGVSGSMIHFSNTMPWNPVEKTIEILGADHNYTVPSGTAPGIRHARYEALTNQFMFLGDQAGLFGHGYDHLSVNPNTGDLYWKEYSAFTGRITVKKKAIGSSSFVNIQNVPATETNAIGTTWWSGPFVGSGAHGSLVIFNSGNASISGASGSAQDGHVVAYNPLTNIWFYTQTGMAPFSGGAATPYTYHSVLEYSPTKNVAVYGGGNARPTKLWHLNADGTHGSMPDTPSGKTVGIQQGNLVNDPVTGNFLLLSAGEHWELNPDGAGTWTKKANPPAGVGRPDSPDIADIDGVISSAIPEFGVIAYITQTSPTGGTFFLYKNAASTRLNSPTNLRVE